MNDGELRVLRLQAFWKPTDPHERVSSQWHARGQGFESPYLHSLSKGLTL